MNFEQDDIEKCKIYFHSQLERKVLSIEAEQLNAFVEFIVDNIIPDSLKGNLLNTIQSYTREELEIIQEKFIQKTEFDGLLSKSFHVEKRKHLKEKLVQLDKEQEESAFGDSITKAFQTGKRAELKEKLQNLESESTSRTAKLISLRPYLKAVGIAASIILIFLVWQPQHSSDKKLFADYSNGLNNNSIADFTQTELIKEQNGLRGEEEHFRNYTYDETLQLLESIELVKQKRFENAKETFNRFRIKKEETPGLTLYLAIAQLNSDDLDEAIQNLEYLNKIPNFLYADETKFHLAFAYLKSGKRKKAKELLNQLANNKNKFTEQASQTLKKIRWF